MVDRPRLILIHALANAMPPIHAALAELWPGVEFHDLLDGSLLADLDAGGGQVDQPMIERFRTLGRYAASVGPGEKRADGILFSCSAFGPAIETVQREAKIPVLKPNESAFAEAILLGRPVTMLVPFEPSLPLLLEEFHEQRSRLGKTTPVVGAFVPHALDALREGRVADYDEMIAAAVPDDIGADTVLLATFSMSRSAPAVKRKAPAATVLTTPHSAVTAMRKLVEAKLALQN